jgi:hypothetical protein
MEFEDVKAVFITIIILSSQLRFILLKYRYKACSKKLLLYSLFLVCTVSYSQMGGKVYLSVLNLWLLQGQLLGGKTITIYDDDGIRLILTLQQ